MSQPCGNTKEGEIYSLVQSSRIRGQAGEPLPNIFQALAAVGVFFLRGQLVLISAGPGTGKSLFVLSYALRSRVPTLYFSADSDAFNQLTRSISILTGDPLQESAQAVREDRIPVEETLDSIPLRFSYDPAPSFSSIETSIEAYEEVYGEYPQLIIIDNVMDVETGEEDNSGLENLMEFLHTMSRATEACVICLHHVNGSYNDATFAIPLSGVKNQITRVPEMVLTLHKSHGDEMEQSALFVSVVKNRGGRADPSGKLSAYLDFDGSTAKISDPARPEAVFN